jgi:hypothetical protein
MRRATLCGHQVLFDRRSQDFSSLAALLESSNESIGQVDGIAEAEKLYAFGLNMLCLLVSQLMLFGCAGIGMWLVCSERSWAACTAAPVLQCGSAADFCFQACISLCTGTISAHFCLFTARRSWKRLLHCFDRRIPYVGMNAFEPDSVSSCLNSTLESCHALRLTVVAGMVRVVGPEPRGYSRCLAIAAEVQAHRSRNVGPLTDRRCHGPFVNMLQQLQDISAVSEYCCQA